MDGERRKGPGIMQVLSKYKLVLLAIGVGAVLLLWPTEERGAEIAAVDAAAAESRTPEEVERAMEEILGRISGVGQVKVMLTMERGSERVLATDSSLRYSGSVQAPDDYSRSSDTVTVNDGSGKGVVVTQENAPLYRGALIVCEGGGNDRVRLAVTEAVAALTGLGSDRIAVGQWQSGSVGE